MLPNPPAIIDRFEALSKSCLVFFILALAFLTFVPNGNEENYLQLAKQFVNPEWIPGAESISEPAGTRLIYQSIVGSFLSVFSFESCTFFFRLLSIVLLSFVLGKIYHELKFSNLELLLHLPILFILHQSFFAGSWMMVSVESKGFAYIAVLAALLFYIRSQFKWATAFLVLATYLHVLVGFYASAYLLLVVLLFESKWRKEIFLCGIGYVLATIPWLLFVAKNVGLNAEVVENADWIYTYFRNPHHTALFYDLLYFLQAHGFGVFLSLAALVLSWKIRVGIKESSWKRLNSFLLLSFLGVLVCVPIAAFDSDGKFLKFYLYRINTLSVFVFTLFLARWIVSRINVGQRMFAFICALAMVFTAAAFYENFKPAAKEILGRNDALIESCEFIKTSTPLGSVILNLESPQNEELSITRRSERDSYFSWNFVPADRSQIGEWYRRYSVKLNVYTSLGLDRSEGKSTVLAGNVLLTHRVEPPAQALNVLLAHEKVDYIFSSKKLKNSPELKSVFSNNSYHLYEIVR